MIITTKADKKVENQSRPQSSWMKERNPWLGFNHHTHLIWSVYGKCNQTFTMQNEWERETKVRLFHQFQSFRTLSTLKMDKLYMQALKTLINWIIRWSLLVKMIFSFCSEAKRSDSIHTHTGKKLCDVTEWRQAWVSGPI